MCSESRISPSRFWVLATRLGISSALGVGILACTPVVVSAPPAPPVVLSPPPPVAVVHDVSVPPPHVNLIGQWAAPAAAWDAPSGVYVREPYFGQPAVGQPANVAPPSAPVANPQAQASSAAVDDVPTEDDEQFATINEDGQPEVAPLTEPSVAATEVGQTANLPAQPAMPPEPAIPEGEEYEDRDPSALTDFDPYLRDYGQWVDHPHYGTVWVPARGLVGPKFVPYVSSGHWALTSNGDWVWESDHPFGWVVFHYGRWIWTSDYGWAWIAGRRYAPAWVRFRTFGQPYVGWGPYLRCTYGAAG